MSFTPDANEKTVNIPVKIVNGRITYLYGKKRIALRDDAIGDLIVRAEDVLDEDWLRVLIGEHSIELLPKGTQILMAMRFPEIPQEMYSRLHDFDEETETTRCLEPKYDKVKKQYTYPIADDSRRAWYGFAFVEVNLAEPLYLRLRGTKPAQLHRATCQIPALDREAASMNHAYTLISQVFEPERRSHTGNVFEKARYFDGAMWHLLDDLRKEKEAAYELNLFADAKKRRRRSFPVQADLGFLTET